MRIALINSGIGLLAAAAALHRMRPDADLVLATDPDGMPWGPRTSGDIADRALLCARAAASYEPDVLVMACNTGSVHALGPMRAEFEPDIPIIGTVPAIKPAAAAYRNVAIWATVATTASAYQHRLIAEFSGSALVTAVACPGLADAVDAGDEAAAAAAVTAAAAQTPAGCEAVVLGCTEYELVADRIRAAVPGAVTFGSAEAVAAQALRRIPCSALPGVALPGVALPGLTFPDGALRALTFPDGTLPDGAHPGLTFPDGTLPDGAHPGLTFPDGTVPDGALPDGTLPDASDAGVVRLGTVRVLLSGRRAPLPPAALRYPEGRLLAPLVPVEDVERDPAAGPGANR